MKENKANLFRHPIVASLIVAAIISLITTLIPNGWKTLFKAIFSIFKWLNGSVSIPIWLLIILSFFGFVILILFLIGIVALFKKDTKSTSRNIGYNEDNFFNLKWRWKYCDWGIYDLASYCPFCDLQVYPMNISHFDITQAIGFRCDDCQKELTKFEGSFEQLENLVKRKIQKKLRSNING